MSKQDRQGARTPAELERKHSRVLSGRDEQNAAQSRQIEQLQQSMSENTGSFNISFMALSDRVSALEQSVPGLGERVTAAEGVNTTQDETIGGLTDRVSALETAVSGISGRLTTAENTLASLEARVATLEG